MSKRLLVLFLLTFFTSVHARPKILALLVQDDPDGQANFMSWVAKLNGCGFDVDVINKRQPAEILQAIDNLDLPPGTPIFVDAHGGMNGADGKPIEYSSGKPAASYVFGQTENGDPRTLVSAQTFLDHLKKAGPRSQVWFDTCHAGGCLHCDSGGVGLGGTCGEDDAAPMNSAMIPVLADLLCSRLKDCKEWHKADTDKDGRISPEELIGYLGKRFKKSREREQWVVKTPEEMSRVEHFCEVRRGTLTRKELPAKKTEVTCEYDAAAVWQPGSGRFIKVAIGTYTMYGPECADGLQRHGDTPAEGGSHRFKSP